MLYISRKTIKKTIVDIRWDRTNLFDTIKLVFTRI